MIKNIVIYLVLLTSAPIHSMQDDDVSHDKHPCLPREFYQGVYSEILKNKEKKIAVVNFARQRLSKLRADLQQNESVEGRGQFAAVLFGLYHTESMEQNSAVQGYGKLVATMSMRALRKRLGLTMGRGEVNPHETWELHKVTPNEFMKRFKEVYSEEDLKRVELIEQIYAHKMLLALAEGE